MERQVVAKVVRRLVPFLILLSLLNYMDRVNVSFAKLHMNADLGFNDEIYGFGASIFFLGYFFCEVPSNLILDRVGARRWLGRIMISWGVIAAAMIFVQGRWSFFSLRLLLGVAEAGFYPGVYLYLSQWIPAAARAKATAWFLTSTAVSCVIGGPLAGMLLQLDGAWGLAGWQWLFLLEGLPSIAAGIVALFYLTDRPSQAAWLSAAEREWLTTTLQAERERTAREGHARLRDAFTQPVVWLLSAVYFLLLFGYYGILFWTPSIIQQATGAGDVTVGVLSALPYVAATVGMVVVGAHSDHTAERRWHVALCAVGGVAGLLLCAAAASAPVKIAGLALAACGLWSALAPFWTMPTVFLTGAAAAAGIAVVNSFGSLSGFLGQALMGHLKESTHDYTWGLLVDAAALAAAAALAVSPWTRPRTHPEMAANGEHR